jgi:hypothetical protein
MWHLIISSMNWFPCKKKKTSQIYRSEDCFRWNDQEYDDKV